MVLKVLILSFAFVVVCEGIIDIPGLEDLQKCSLSDKNCLVTNLSKVMKILSKPIPKYFIKGYDPIMIPSLEVFNPKFQIDLYLKDIQVTGLGDTKIVDHAEKDLKVETTLEQTLKFTMTAAMLFRQNPVVVREGFLSGEFVGIRSNLTYDVRRTPRNGDEFIELYNVWLQAVEMPSGPRFNPHQYSSFISHPDTHFLASRIIQNSLEFYKPVAEAILLNIYPQFFNDRNTFLNNFGVSELLLPGN